MRRLLIAVALSCVSASAQTINPKQIRPSPTDGQVLTTAGGVTIWGSGGSGGNILATPQYRVMFQPNAGTQAVAGGATVGTNAVAPMLQGTINPDLYATGGGNNGIANALASSACTTAGCAIERPFTSTDTESMTSLALNSGLTSVKGKDLAYGVRRNYFLNSGNLVGSPNILIAGGDDYFWNKNPSSSATNFIGHQGFLTSANGGIYVGSPWTVVQDEVKQDYFYTRSISQSRNTNTYCFKVGDCAEDYVYLHYRNGEIATSDEGIEPRYTSAVESDPPSGTITTGGANATTVKSNFTSNGANAADGMNLLSTSEIGASGLLISTTTPGGNVPTQVTTSDSHAVNTAYATLSGACGANVKRDSPVATACTITGLTGTFSAAAGATVCVADWHYPEQVSITAASSTSVTLGLTYAHPSGMVIEQGPMCGQKLAFGYGQTNPLNNKFITTYFVAGSPTATTLDVVVVYKGGQNGKIGINIPSLPSQALGTLTRTSNVVSTNFGAASAIRQYNNFSAGSAAITISGASNSDFNGVITGVNASTIPNATWAQTGPNETATGATISLVGYNNYVAYCGAEVVRVLGVTIGAGDHPDTPQLDGTLQVEANNCNWPAGQPVIQPNHYASNVAAHFDVLNGFTPPSANPNYISSVLVGGAAWSGGIDDNITTSDSYSKYVVGGGTWLPHTHFNTNAFYGTVINMTSAPVDGGVFLSTGCPPAGCSTGMNWRLFQLQGNSGVSRFSFTPLTNAFDIDNLTIGGKLPCLVDGTNCPSGSSISLTTTGNSGAATLTGSVLNIPNPTNASALTSGTVADARLSGNVPLLNGINTFTTQNNFNGTNFFITPSTATSSVNYSSSIAAFSGSYWTGSNAADDQWDISDVVGSGVNPTSTLNLSHVVGGTTGTVAVQVPNLIVTGTCTGCASSSSGFPITLGSTSIASSSTTTSIAGLTLTSPTLTTPALGTPASGVATNLTGTAAGLTAGLAQNLTGSPAITVSSCTGCGTGSGNTTSTSLTTNALPKANGANSIINSALTDDGTTATYTGTGGMKAASFTGTGTTPTAFSLPAGTGSIPALPANSGGFAAPVTGGAPYLIKLPATITAGIPHYAAAATGDGVNESIMSVSSVSNADLANPSTTVNGVTCTLGSTCTVTASGIANTTTTVGTTAIAANTCATAVTVTMTGVATTSVFDFTPATDVSAVTGWGTTGGLTIIPWPTSNTLNYKVCNQTAASITPSASVTFNVGAR